MNNLIMVDDATAKKYLEKIDLIDVMQKMFTSLAKQQAIQPPQLLSLFPSQRGDFITYLGCLAEENVFGVKVSPYIIRAEQKPLVTAWTLLMSMETGNPMMIFDAQTLTIERTAATTALATDYLATKESKKLVVIGSGKIAEAHIQHIKNLREWEEICIYSTNLEKKPLSLKNHLKSLDQRIKLLSSLEEAINNADVILLCTSSGSPVLDPLSLTKPALISSISTNIANAHEIPPESLAHMEVYCDYKETSPESAGEMILAKQDHGWSSQSIKADLADLVSNRGLKPTHTKPIFFRSIGLGLEDIAIASSIYKLAKVAQ